MKPHDLTQIKEGNVERQQNGLELRKSHFTFGTDEHPCKPEDVMGV